MYLVQPCWDWTIHFGTYLIEWDKWSIRSFDRRTIRRILHFLPPLPRPHRYQRWDQNARLSFSCEIDSSINSRTDGVVSITPLWCLYITVLDRMFIRKIMTGHLDHMRFVISSLHRFALSWRINECSSWPSKITLWRSNVIHQALYRLNMSKYIQTYTEVHEITDHLIIHTSIAFSKGAIKLVQDISPSSVR